MEIKSYIDEIDNDCPPDIFNRKSLPDGRRVQENVTTVELDDGSVQEVHEILEEVVPMRVTKRVSRKMMTVPVEEKVECIGADGSIQTKVKSIDTSLLPAGSFGVNAVEPMALQSTTTSVNDKRNRSFMSMADSLYADEVAKPNVAVKVESDTSMEVFLTAVAWLVFAVVAGLVTYTLIS